MGQAKTKTPAEIAGVFNSGNQALIEYIIYNNPDDVAQNLNDMGYCPGIAEAEDIADYLENGANEMSRRDFIDAFSVPFRNDALNNTSGADIQAALTYQMQITTGANNPSTGSLNWGVFADGLGKLWDANFSKLEQPRQSPDAQRQLQRKRATDFMKKVRTSEAFAWVMLGLGVIGVTLLTVAVVKLFKTPKQ